MKEVSVEVPKRKAHFIEDIVNEYSEESTTTEAKAFFLSLVLIITPLSASPPILAAGVKKLTAWLVNRAKKKCHKEGGFSYCE